LTPDGFQASTCSHSSAPIRKWIDGGVLPAVSKRARARILRHVRSATCTKCLSSRPVSKRARARILRHFDSPPQRLRREESRFQASTCSHSSARHTRKPDFGAECVSFQASTCSHSSAPYQKEPKNFSIYKFPSEHVLAFFGTFGARELDAARRPDCFQASTCSHSSAP